MTPEAVFAIAAHPAAFLASMIAMCAAGMHLAGEVTPLRCVFVFLAASACLVTYSSAAFAVWVEMTAGCRYEDWP